MKKNAEIPWQRSELKPSEKRGWKKDGQALSLLFQVSIYASAVSTCLKVSISVSFSYQGAAKSSCFLRQEKRAIETPA